MNNYLTAVNSGQIFKSGMVSNTVSSVNMSIGLSGTAGDISTMLFGSVSGGLGAALTGGNFWQGAAIGLTVSALNHVAHRMIEPRNGELYVFDDTDRVNGQGHTSIGGKTGNSKYEYVSSEGRVDSDGNSIIGGEAVVTHKTYNDFETLMSEIIRPQGYDKMLTIKNLTYGQVRTAMGAALSQAESYYQFAISNCFTVVAEAMRSIGLYDGGFGTFIPNNGFYNIFYHYNPRKWYE